VLTYIGFVPGIGIQEALILGVVLILVFGARRLPEIGRSLGGGMREFKESITAQALDAPAPRQTLPPAEPRMDSAEATREETAA
jgi:sec-independent protein translocase protein TatA